MAYKGKDKNKPNFILKFSDEKLTPEQDNEIIAEFIFTLMRWQENEEKTNELKRLENEKRQTENQNIL